MVTAKEFRILCGIAAIVGIDQLSKILATQFLVPANVITLPLGAALRYTENTGAAFSLLSGARWFFIVVALIVLSALWLNRRQFDNSAWQHWGLILLMGGTLGNLLDRILFGVVRDFIDLGWWPVFNIADSALVVGAIIIIASMWISGHPKHPSTIIAHKNTSAHQKN